MTVNDLETLLCFTISRKPCQIETMLPLVSVLFNCRSVPD